MVRQWPEPREGTTSSECRKRLTVGYGCVVIDCKHTIKQEITPSHVRLRRVLRLIRRTFVWKTRTSSVATSMSILLVGATETSIACLFVSVHPLLLSSMHPQQELQNLSWTGVRAWLLLLDEENTMPLHLPWSSAPTIEHTRPTTP